MDALARRSDVQVIAVCDPDPRTAEQTAAGWHARVYPNGEELLDKAKPVALWVCVPAALQGAIISEAAARRIPFFVEPPGAGSFEQAKSNAALVAEAGLVTAVAFATRHTDVVLEAREYLGTHAVPLALGSWLRPAERAASTAADLLWSEACHLVDALRFFCGEVRAVQALETDADRGGMVIQLQFETGTVGVLTCATFARPEPQIALEMLGDGWTLSFTGGLRNLRLAERDRTTLLRCLNDPAGDQVAAFVDAVSKGEQKELPGSYGDALKTLAICHAAVQSAREGRAVPLAVSSTPMSPTPTSQIQTETQSAATPTTECS